MKSIGSFLLLYILQLSCSETSSRNSQTWSKEVLIEGRSDSTRYELYQERTLNTRFLSGLHFANGSSAIPVLIHVDMTEAMQHEVVEYAIAAMDSHASNLATYICSRMKTSHSGDWHCFFHEHRFGYQIHPDDRYYFYFQLNSKYILVFRK